MSLIAEYRNTEAEIKELQARLAQLSSNERLQKEMEFEEKLRALMGEYGKSLRDIQQLLDPQPVGRAAPAKQQKRERRVKVYRNPNTGETIETKGGNHKLLKEWKAEYGSDTVESWVS